MYIPDQSITMSDCSVIYKFYLYYTVIDKQFQIAHLFSSMAITLEP